MSLDDLQKRAPDPLVGTRLGQVDIDRWMADGETGTIYFGHLAVSRKEVALRVLCPEMTQRPGFTKRFLYEARVAQQVRHPNVVKVIEAGEQDGHVYITMEFVKGEPLKALIQRQGKLEFEQATVILRDIARGLEAAHRLELIHGDLRPSNILMDLEGNPRINNFGLARPASVGSGRTQVGDFVGPPEYLSPEQADNRLVDARTDQYSLGLIYYEMLAGRRPFEGVNDADIAKARLKADVPAIDDLPLRGRQLLGKLAARDPRDRYPGMREVVASCEHALQGAGEAQDREPEKKSAPHVPEHPTWSRPKNVIRMEETPPPTKLPRAPAKPRRSGVTELADAPWVSPTKIGWAYFAYALAVACVAAGAGMRRIPPEARLAFAASSIFPLGMSATLLLRQRTGWRGFGAVVLGTVALGLMFWGFMVAQSWSAFASRMNATALGLLLIVSVGISVLRSFEHGVLRRLMVLGAFALIAWGVGLPAEVSRGVIEWIRAAPATALAVTGITVLAAMWGVLLLCSPGAGPGMRLLGFVGALGAAVGIGVVSTGGVVAPLVADLPFRLTHHGSVATLAIIPMTCGHILLKGRS